VAVAYVAESGLRSNLLLFRRIIVTVIAAVSIPAHPFAHKHGCGDDSFSSYRAKSSSRLTAKEKAQ
jgi:hypothetical protein